MHYSFQHLNYNFWIFPNAVMVTLISGKSKAIGLSKEANQDGATLLRAFIAYVIGMIFKSVDRNFFRRRKRQCGETVETLVVNLRNLSKSCTDECRDKAIRDQLKEGLCDQNAIHKLLETRQLTLQAAMDIVQTLESAMNSVKHISRSDHEVSRLSLYKKRTGPCVICSYCKRNGYNEAKCYKKMTDERPKIQIITDEGKVDGIYAPRVKALPGTGADICDARMHQIKCSTDDLSSPPISTRSVNGHTIQSLSSIPVRITLQERSVDTEIQIFRKVQELIVSWRASMGLIIVPCLLYLPKYEPHDSGK